MEKTYEIKGMKCMGCVNKVKESFEKVPGVENVTVDLETKTATVTGNVTKEALSNSLADTKFEVIA